MARGVDGADVDRAKASAHEPADRSCGRPESDVSGRRCRTGSASSRQAERNKDSPCRERLRWVVCCASVSGSRHTGAPRVGYGRESRDCTPSGTRHCHFGAPREVDPSGWSLRSCSRCVPARDAGCWAGAGGVARRQHLEVVPVVPRASGCRPTGCIVLAQAVATTLLSEMERKR